MQFAIISVGHNCARFVNAWHQSIYKQRNVDWCCYVAIDPSTDGTDSIVSRLVAGDARFRVVANSSRQYCLHNTYRCIALVDNPDTIIVTLDLDDAFYTDKALDIVALAYDNSTWMTYGSYADNHGGHANWCRTIPDHVWKNNSHRSNVWSTSALRTFKKWLWDLIKPEDFRLPDGQWYMRATDRAFMYPMLEMAGPDHVKYIRETLYLYNLYGQHELMLNDENVALKHILSKKPYPRLNGRP